MYQQSIRKRVLASQMVGKRQQIYRSYLDSLVLSGEFSNELARGFQICHINDLYVLLVRCTNGCRYNHKIRCE